MQYRLNVPADSTPKFACMHSKVEAPDRTGAAAEDWRSDQVGHGRQGMDASNHQPLHRDYPWAERLKTWPIGQTCSGSTNSTKSRCSRCLKVPQVLNSVGQLLTTDTRHALVSFPDVLKLQQDIEPAHRQAAEGDHPVRQVCREPRKRL